MSKTRVWDLPIRITHWLIVSLFITLWLTAEFKSDYYELAEIHFYLGYTLLGVILFRVALGFWGSTYAKFNHFSLAPRALIDHLKGHSKPYAGHNAPGSWMTLTLLILLLCQVLTGLFSFDNALYLGGPYSESVSSSLAELATSIHSTIFDLLCIAVITHIGAIIIYRIKAKDYLSSMINGNKGKNIAGDSPDYTPMKPILLITSCIVAAGLAYFLSVHLPGYFAPMY